MKKLMEAAKEFRYLFASSALVVCLIALATFGSTWGDKSNAELGNAGNEPTKVTCPADTERVSFYVWTGSSVPDQDVCYGDKATRPADPTNAGYTFVNWYYSDMKTVYDFDAPVTDNITISAMWTINGNCTASFDSNGGSATQPQTMLCGMQVAKPANPTKAGYSFSGWYADSALSQPYDFSAPITSDLTLYAAWVVSESYNCTASAWITDAPTVCPKFAHTGENVKITVSLTDPSKSNTISLTIGEALKNHNGDVYWGSNGKWISTDPSPFSMDLHIITLTPDSPTATITVPVESTHTIDSTNYDVQSVYVGAWGGDSTNKLHITYEAA